VIGAAAMALVWPVSMSIVAELLPPERLSEGLGLQKSAQSVGRLLGPVLGGAAITTGIAPALWLHAAMLLVACVLAARIETPPAAQRHRMPPRWLAELKAGLAAKWQVPLERGWTLVSFLVMVFFTPGIGMLVPLKVQSLGLSGAWLGACEAGLSAGMLFGALGGSMWLAQRVGRFRASFGALMCEGACFAVLGLAQWPLLVVAVFVLHGACVITVNMVGHTHRMLAMPAHFRARMTAVNLMVMQVAGALGPGLAGAALARWSVGQVYVAFGLGVFLAALGYLRVPGYRRFLELPHDEAEGHYARLHPQLFGTPSGEGTDREGFAARKSL
jgi:MFS family permease